MPRIICFILCQICAALCAASSMATTHYVDYNSAIAAPPYTSWTTAATDIQAAIDVCDPGDLILVTNGTYSVSSQILVTDDLSVRSVNGPALTIIDGNSNTRCIHLYTNSILAGFTVTGGRVDGNGGGIYCEDTSAIITNCIIVSNTSLDHRGGGIFSGTAINCEIFNNTAGAYSDGGGISDGIAFNCNIYSNFAYRNGGGLFNSTADHCTIQGNRSNIGSGGGVYGGAVYNSVIDANISSSTSGDGAGLFESIAINCVIRNNNAGSGYGGGAYNSTLEYCTITNNYAQGGAGVYGGTARFCTISKNTANAGGTAAGAYLCDVYSSVVSYNWAQNVGGLRGGSADGCLIIYNTAFSSDGGGTWGTAANNCTILFNECGKRDTGGGMYGGTATNCIVYYNTRYYGNNVVDNMDSVTAGWTCSPDIIHGLNGNITNAPLFAATNNFRLTTASPCIDVGNNATVAFSTDLDGNPRIVDGTADMGAYEYGFEGCFITNLSPTDSGTGLNWTAFPMWETKVMYSTNLASMPFTELTNGLAFPINCFTDTLHNVENECFYMVEISP